MAPWIDQLVREHRPVPLVAELVAATGDLSWAPAITLGITLPALLLPDGHLRSRRWWLVVVTSVTGIVLVAVAGPLSPGPLESTGIDNPFGLAGRAGDVAAVLTVVGVVLHWLSLPPAAVCVVLRFRSSHGVERQQMRWVAAGVAGAVAGLLLGLPGGLGIAPGWISFLVFPALLCPPVAVGVAVLRGGVPLTVEKWTDVGSGDGCYAAAATAWSTTSLGADGLNSWRRRSCSKRTPVGVWVTPRQPGEARSRTAQTSDRQLCSPGSRPIPFTRLRVSPKVRSTGVGVADAVVVLGGEAQVGGELGTVGEQAAHRGWRAWAVATGEGIDAGLDRVHQLLAGVGVQVVGLEDRQ